MRSRVLLVTLLAGGLFLLCNNYSNQPVGDYRISVTWPANTDSLVPFTNYPFSYQIGQDRFDSIFAYTTPVGFIDTAAANLSIANSPTKNGTVYFVTTGACWLYVEGRTADGRIGRDSCAVTVRSPWAISGDTLIDTGVSTKLFLVPSPNAGAMIPNIKAEWKIDGVRRDLLALADTFTFAGADTGRYIVIVSFVDTTATKNFSAAVDTVVVSVRPLSFAVTWPSNADSLALFTDYHFTCQTGQDIVSALSVFTVPAGFVDTAAANTSFANNQGTYHFIKTGTCQLYVEGRTADGRTARDSCAITVRNPYAISGDPLIETGDSTKLFLTPRPDAGTTTPNVKAEWKVDGVRRNLLAPTDTFTFADTDTGRYTIIVSFVDTTATKNFSVELDTVVLRVFPPLSITATWPSHLDSLAFFTDYSFTCQTGQDTVTTLSVYTIPAGFVDTAAANASCANNQGTFHFIKTGACQLYIKGRTADGRTGRDSCAVTIRNPYVISGDTVIKVNDPDKLFLAPRPDADSMAATALIQWKINGVLFKLSRPADTFSFASSDTGRYTVIASFVDTAPSKNFSAPLDTIVVNVFVPPTITVEPQSQILYLRQSVTFSVTAAGHPAPQYLWQKNGIVIDNATGPSYTINAPAITDSGKYTVVVFNRVGMIISDTAAFYAGTQHVAVGLRHTLFLKTDGTLWSCGSNIFGQLGTGRVTGDTIPQQIMTEVMGCAAGDFHSMAVKTDGTLWAFGRGQFGQLGIGSSPTTPQALPTQVLLSGSIQQVAAGSSHTLILKTDGTLWVCGRNTLGQLCSSSFNATTDVATPVQVMPGTGIRSIAAGFDHSLVFKNDGTLWSCGANTAGQLGDSTFTNNTVPKVVRLAPVNIRSISAAGNSSFAITTDDNGTLWDWGFNSQGQLGNGTTANRSYPGLIMTDVQSVGSGSYATQSNHTLFLKNNGSLFACGINEMGQMANGTASTTSQLVPLQVISGGVRTIFVGGDCSFILKTDNTLWACGTSFDGKMGVGATAQSSALRRVKY
jgi:alpha-tubulin suppressor-like RCC1 family protein